MKIGTSRKGLEAKNSGFIVLFCLMLFTPSIASEALPEWARALPQLKAEGGWIHYDSLHVTDVGSLYLDFENKYFLFRGIAISPYEESGRHGMDYCQGLIKSFTVSPNKKRIEFKGHQDRDPDSPSPRFTFEGYLEKSGDNLTFSIMVSKGLNISGRETREFFRTLRDGKAKAVVAKVPLDFGR